MGLIPIASSILLVVNRRHCLESSRSCGLQCNSTVTYCILPPHSRARVGTHPGCHGERIWMGPRILVNFVGRDLGHALHCTMVSKIHPGLPSKKELLSVFEIIETTNGYSPISTMTLSVSKR